jgi:hypothetical protein
MDFKILKERYEAGDIQITVREYSRNHKGEYEYAFNWIEGGFNQVWANTYEDALKKALFMASKHLHVDLTTIRKVTVQQSRDLTKIGNMNAC